MKILIACEYSGIVRDAFLEKGHDAISCDILPTESKPERHYQGDVMDIINDGWDMMVGFPPCTFLTYAGTQSWNNEGRVWDRLKALEFFAKLWTAPIPKIALENPKGCASPTIAKYSQVIQPFQFGDPYIKTTLLWLKGLPLLTHNPMGGLFESTEVQPIGYHIDGGGVKAYKQKEYDLRPSGPTRTLPLLDRNSKSNGRAMGIGYRYPDVCKCKDKKEGHNGWWVCHAHFVEKTWAA